MGTQGNSHKPYPLTALRECKSLISSQEQVKVAPMVNISLFCRPTLGNNRSNDKGVGYLVLLGALEYFNNKQGGAMLSTRGQGPGCRN